MQTTLRKIGNSFGVTINQKLLTSLGLTGGSVVIIEANDKGITISPISNRRPINRDIKTWRSQITRATKRGEKPGKSAWGNTSTSSFDQSEWI